MYRGDERTPMEHFKADGLTGRSAFGYLAPEQFDCEEHNYKVGMYTFGLLLLDLFCDGDPWYCHIPRVGDPEDFGPNESPPLHLALKQCVFDANAWNLITKLADIGPDARPESSKISTGTVSQLVDMTLTTVPATATDNTVHSSLPINGS
ncbi:hypothetical protein PAXINDRAFT_100366 [Paxillus involutus ATCC 200175]|uniref:Protein kinase domain-containing protein n=1 Tax=Paxillus involutus ATCC 200175 TaxID=664439 RepID=A0A0C9U3B1_PAXIN|nr:hypothetical protein PAXINDRAFT_100366 [Paxillus involutus ATCC 200175]